MPPGGQTLRPAEPSLVETKLSRPRNRAHVVARPRLLGALDGHADTELTLVSAPVGGGKSLLVGSWCDARPDSAVAWVSLDAADDDASRLWTYIATGVDRIRPGLGRAALGRLSRPGAGITAAVDELLNGISAFGEPVTIVLDDLHMLHDEATLRSFEYAVEHLPSNARVVATTRIDPPIRLGRLRARRALGELRAKDLAFTLDEARELLVVQEGIDLDEHDLSLLLERSEGWPAGLYLAALWLREHDDPHAGVRDFTGDHRHVADYLSSEVVDALDPVTRDFVLATSVLGRLSGPLCDATLETTGSAELLAQLARSNLFLVSLDGRGRWYRYHHLFGELLRVELLRTDPAGMLGLHRRAATWYRAEGLIEEALEHADAAGDDGIVAEVLLENHAQMLRTGREATLLRWLDRVSAEALLDWPQLPAAAALASGLLSRPARERDHLLALAERSARDRPERWSTYTESLVSLARGAWIDGDTARAIEQGRKAAELGRNGADETVVAALGALGYALYLGGHVDESRDRADEAVARPEATHRPHGVVLALATLALLDADAGRPHLAKTSAERALELAARTGLGGSWSAGLAHTALATALLGEHDHGRVEREASRGEELRRSTEPTVEHAHAQLVLVEAQLARGRLAAAVAGLDLIRESLATFADAGRLPARASRLEEALRLAAANGEPLDELPSRAELAVLALLATDLTQREIGKELFLSLNTVKTHTRSLYRKLGTSSREDAIRRAATLGLLDDPAVGPGPRLRT